MGLLKKLFGTSSEKELRAIKPIVDKIEALDGEYSKLTDEQLKAKTPEFKQRIANGESLDDILPEAFAACREAAWRVLGMKPYRVQLIGGIVLGYIWQLLLNGVLALWDRSLTTSAVYGFWGMVILLCWQQIGYMMVIYIAGFQSLPTDLIEAAQVDGASNGQIMRRIIIPLMMPSVTVCSFLTVANGFKMFDQNLALTNGAPSNASEMIAFNIYRTMYGRTGFEGVAQAKAVIFFIIVAVVAFIQNRITTSKEVEA